MKSDIYNGVYIISNFFTIFIIHRFIELFFQKPNYNKIICYISYIMYFIITSIAYIFIDIPILKLLINYITIFIISLTYESNIQKRVTYTTYIVMFMLFPELIVGAVTEYFHFSFFENGNYSNILGIIITKIVTYSEALILRNFKFSKDKQNVSWSTWISAILIPIATIIYEIMFISCEDLTESKVITSVILLIVTNVTAFYLYDSLARNYIKHSKFVILQQEKELYNKQYEIMQNSTEELQKFRHDINNHFLAIYELLSSEKYEDAKKQLINLTNLTKDKIIFSNSGNIIIDGLINCKLHNILKENIKIKTEIAVPKELNIDTTDIVTIIGNLLDNALTAIDSTEKEKMLIIKIAFNKQRLIIHMSNSFSGDIICRNGKIITSKQEHWQHGYGLSNISRTVDKYNGYMETNYTESIFMVDIILYL